MMHLQGFMAYILYGFPFNVKFNLDETEYVAFSGGLGLRPGVLLNFDVCLR